MALGLSVLGAAAPTFAAPYQIKQDDTFALIAQRHALPLQSVLDANAGVDPLNLQVGQTIQLPGTKVAKATSAIPHAYSRQITAKATAYTGSPEENGGWAGLDYFGNKLKVGTIAVDPSVIPLGTTVYITGYKSGMLPSGGMIAKATDIGGAIKGNRVDIFVPGKDASSFGIQNVRIYILK